MSASLLVDLGNTCLMGPVTLPTFASGTFAASGATIGQSVDLLNANTFCNLIAMGVPLFTSGQLRLQVQCSDFDTSGSYVDPTSGLAQLPTSFQSGGIVIINSGGLLGGVLGAQTSGQS